MDSSKAYSVEQGVIVDEENDGPFFTGGAASPVGQGMPFNTVYLQTAAGGHFIWKKVGAGDTSADWRKYSAQDVPFDATGLKFSSSLVSTALDELRNRNVQSIESHTTTLNGTDTLDVDSVTMHIFTGTATGYSVVLPDATTLFDGRVFQVVNESSESILLKDDGGTTLRTLISGDVATITLEDNGTTDGDWLITVVSGAATGITSYVLETSTLFTTSSATDVVITGFTVTPVSGRYAVWFSSSLEISQNNKLAQSVVYVGGVADEGTRRAVQGVSSNFQTAFFTQGEVSVNGSQAIDVRVNIDSGSIDVTDRSLLLIRLGA